MADSFKAILDDAAAAAADAARKVVGAVKPHVTLDNAGKIIAHVNGALDAVEKARRIGAPRK